MVSVRCGGAGWGGWVREALGYQGGGNWGGRKQKVEIVVMGMRLDVSERLGWVGVCVCVCVCVCACQFATGVCCCSRNDRRWWMMVPSGVFLNPPRPIPPSTSPPPLPSHLPPAVKTFQRITHRLSMGFMTGKCSCPSKHPKDVLPSSTPPLPF